MARAKIAGSIFSTLLNNRKRALSKFGQDLFDWALVVLRLVRLAIAQIGDGEIGSPVR